MKIVGGMPGQLTLAEARAILIAHEALDISYETRLASGQVFGLDEIDAWAKIVEAARAALAGMPL